VPESKGRSKPAYTPPRTAQSTKGPSPRWWAPAMIVFMVLGLAWVATFYISGTRQLPLPQLGRWNLGVGFGLMMAGFLMTTRWR
jgi:hypothetical protein